MHSIFLACLVCYFLITIFCSFLKQGSFILRLDSFIEENLFMQNTKILNWQIKYNDF